MSWEVEYTDEFEAADDLGLKIGDSIVLLAANNRQITVRVTAIFEFGIKDLDRRWVYLSLRSAQNLLDLKAKLQA